MNRPTFLTTLLVASACAGAPTTEPTTPRPSEVADSPPTSSVPPRSAASFPTSGLVSQTIDATVDDGSVLTLSDGRVVVVAQNEVVLTDTSLQVVRRIPVPTGTGYGSRNVAAPDGSRVVTDTAIVDLRSGEATRNGSADSSLLACDPDVGRCLYFLDRSGSGDIVLDAVPPASALARIAIDQAALSSRVPSERPGAVDVWRPSYAALDGSRAIVAFPGSTPRVCSLDLANQTIGVCIPTRHIVRALAVDPSTHRVAIGTVMTFGWYETTTLALVGTEFAGATLEDFAPDGSTFVRTIDDVGSVVDGHDHAVLATAAGRDDRISVGPDRRFSIHSASGIRLHRGTEALAQTTLATRVDRSTTTILWDPSGAIALARPDGLARIVPGATDVPFVGPRETEYGARIEAEGESILIRTPAHSLLLGREGITPRTAPVDSEPDSEPDSESTDPLDRMFPLDEYGSRVLATAPEASNGPVFAYLAGRSVRFTDRAGVDRIRPVPLPARVAASGCSVLEFVSDVDVALSGSAPCIPTLVHSVTRRTEPLGAAYVSIARTPDLGRTLMLANRRLRLVDGRSGATLLDFDPELPHPRTVEISSDGTRAALYGTDGFVVLDFRAALASTRPDASAIRIARFEAAWPRMYGADMDRVFGCDGAALVLADPFDLDQRTRIEGGACSVKPETSSYATQWLASGRVLAAREADAITIVRATDGSVLRLRLAASWDELAIAVEDGAHVVGVYPDDSGLFVFRDDATNARVRTATSAAEAAAAVRAFFASP